MNPSENNMSETQFLSQYDASKYERPSVTADIVVLTLNDDDALSVLLVQRGGHPFQGCWAIPGGFLQAGKESTEEAAARELFEETGIRNADLRQLATFSSPDRDPRTHVVSVAYTALVPKGALVFQAGDDAAAAKLFQVRLRNGRLSLITDTFTLSEKDLAFDHAEILKAAIDRLRNRVDYTPDAVSLLADKSAFTVYELKQAYDAVKDTKLDNANFRKMFSRVYLEQDLVSRLDCTRKDPGRKPAALYAYTTSGQD